MSRENIKLKITKNLIISGILLFVANVSFAQTDPSKYGMDVSSGLPMGLAINSEAPDFRAQLLSGSEIKLSDAVKDSPVVLIFYRGEWCPVCNRYLSNLQDSLTYITAAGAAVYAVTPEVVESASKMKEKIAASFKIIPDPKEEILNKYDVLFDVTEAYYGKIKNRLDADIAINNGKEKARLPVPATYIIDKNMKIVYRQFDYNYGNRASVKEIIDNLPSN